MPAAARDPEFYLTHAGTVRRLARELVFDEHLAADVEQDVWVATLQHRPRDEGATRSWLRSLVRNLAIKAWRGSARRTRREAHVARDPALSVTPAEVLEHEATRRRLVEALLALDEPTRAVLLARYFDDESPRAIAARLGLPLETVRTRQKRGLERLRERLRRDGEDGRAFALALVRAFRLSPLEAPGWPLVLRTLVMGGLLLATSHKIQLVGATAAALVVALLVTRSGRREPNTGERGDDPRSVVIRAAEGPADPASPARAPVRVEPAVSERSSKTTVAADALAGLDVVVRWYDGTPAANVVLRVSRPGADDLAQRPLVRRTDAEGRVRLDGLGPGRCLVQPTRGGYGSADLVAGRRVALEIVLPRGFDVTGRVVDEAGAPVRGAALLLWRARRAEFDLDEVARSDGDGRFFLRSIDPEGNPELSARANGHAPSRRRVLLAAEGTRRDVEIVLPGAGASLAGRVLDARGIPAAGAIVLAGSGGDWAPITEPDGSRSQPAPGVLVRADDDGTFRAEGLPLGPLEVRARAPGLGFARERIDTASESFVELRLTPPSALHGTVTDEAGVPLEHVVVQVGAYFTFDGNWGFTEADGSYALPDLPSGEAFLACDGGPRGRTTETRFLASGTDLEWNVVLTRGPEIRGRIETSVDVPAAGWVVLAEALDGRRAGWQRFADADDQGRFAFHSLDDVAYRLSACPPGDALVAVARVGGIRPGPGEVVLRPDPAHAPSVHIVGRILAADGRALPGASLHLRHPDLVRAPPIQVGADGEVALGPLAPGDWTLVVAPSGRPARRLGPRTLRAGETWDLGEVRLEAGGGFCATVRTAPGLEARVRWLEVLDASGRPVEHVEPDGERLCSGPLEAGTYDLVAFAGDEVALRRERVEVRADERSEVELRLEPGVPVRWRIVDAKGGAPEGRVSSRLSDAEGQWLAWPTVLRSPQGLTGSAGLAPGRYRLDVFGDGVQGTLDLEVGSTAPTEPLRCVVR